MTLRAQDQSVPEIGVVQEVENDELLGEIGFRVLVEGTPKLLSPREVSEEAFAARLPELTALEVPLYACNLFIPADLKVVGPEVDEEAVLAYVDTVLERAQRMGLTLITWGSGGSRSVPEGFERDTARQQFIAMAGKVAEVAARYDMILALENLNSTECNFITTLAEALSVVKAVDHPHFRLCVDIYHMLKEGESAESIAGSKDYAVYCEVAEREGRAPPGFHGDDFTPYFTALKQEGYTGKVVIECRWRDLEQQGPAALAYLTRQLQIAFE